MSTPPLSSEITPADLIDQLCDAFEAAWRAGERPRIEEYLARVDEPVRSRLWAELLLSELECRRRQGEVPTPQEYHERFPDRHDHLERLFANVTPGGVSHTVPSPAPATIRVGELHGYELLGEIARGGMGVVYKARQVALNRIVAVKMILAGAHAGPGERARFRREAEAAARLQHRHIVQIHEIGEADGLPFLAMEYVDGPSLDNLLARWHAQGRVGLTPHDAARLVETLASAIHCAHQWGVVHRDLKPANVLLSFSRGSANRADEPPLSECVPKITDFGLAKLLDGAGEPTRTGALLGTPRYMAPEQAGGLAARVGPATDVYALGMIRYELLTGSVPFQAATVTEILELVRTAEPVPPCQLQPKLPRDLQTICLKCLHKEPARRYASAEALAEDLRHFLAGEPIRARPTSTAERVIKWVKRRPAVALLTAAVVLTTLLAAGGWIWWELERAAQRSAATLRRDRTARQVQELLGKVIALQAGGQPAQALDHARQAEWLLERAEGLDEFRQQVRELTAELDAEERGQRLLSRMEAIRLRKPFPTEGIKAPELDAALSRAFREEQGIELDTLTPKQVAKRFRPSARAALAAAMTFWAQVRRYNPGGKASWERVLAVAQAADPDAFRCEVRKAVVQGDRKTLVALADSDKLATLPPVILGQLGEALGHVGEHQRAVTLLRQAHHDHPGDLWINHYLAVHYGRVQPPQWEEALRFLTAAEAVRPDSAGVRLNVGNALVHQGRLREAIAAYKKATHLDSSLAPAFYNLGSAHYLLKENSQAIAAFQKAATLDPKHASAFYALGRALLDEERFAEAVAASRKAVELLPADVETRCQLANALRRAGLFHESLVEYQRAKDLAKDPLWRNRVTRALQQAESLVAYDKALPAILKDNSAPPPARHCLRYAQVCYNKQLYGSSARLFETALTGKAGELNLDEKASALQWFNAACAAAKAGCGHGADAAQYDERQRTEWREQSLRWLQMSLAYWETQLAGDVPQASAEAVSTLQLWRRTRALSGLRDPEALARLTAKEREACRKVWEDIAALLTPAEGK